MSKKWWTISGANKSMICFDGTTTGRVCVGILLVVFVGCSSSQRFVEQGSRGGPKPSKSGHSVLPNSGKVLLTLEGVVSFYAHDFHGKKTSNGETFDMNALTAAHRTFPFGTKVRVTNLENKKVVIVRVNDRGPFIDGRIMDLSMGAAKEVDLILSGTTKAKLEVLEWGNGK
jgi:rare lipoprotein A